MSVPNTPVWHKGYFEVIVFKNTQRCSTNEAVRDICSTGEVSTCKVSSFLYHEEEDNSKVLENLSWKVGSNRSSPQT